ncbi:TlpA family protein disulfide reductase [Flavobacterium sp. LS1R49]|uniref:TlpA family protein disulfide reductase n=1 Tax=Flavobacterium shii TaxID=2987687 RepID=A0A9X3C628_9FLAO|nr:TlpA disulfide reductase family protein [Flavobacterium shii]MCV9928902.1 TlpA family protein disulfide reductase [Flavobacterium shii]
MKKSIAIIITFLVFAYSSAQTKYGNPEVDPMQIQKDYSSWWTYQSKNIMLSRDFVALDTLSREIPKETFLDQLANGNNIPIRLQSDDAIYYYKLFKINPNSDTSIKATINQEAFDAYKNFKMENTPFPKFSFKDLNGNLVSNETMKGKIIVIKCWYIHCASCIKEFPDVNKLAEKYKDRKDILFVSLAEDTPEQLKVFLARKPLSYSVIPNMKIYMNETLQLNAFPTHFIINKEGLIAKVLNNYKSLEVALEKESEL